MTKAIRAFDNKDQPIVGGDNETLSHAYFNIVALNKDQKFEYQLDGFESIYVVLSGKCDIAVNTQAFNAISNLFMPNDMMYAFFKPTYGFNGQHVLAFTILVAIKGSFYLTITIINIS